MAILLTGGAGFIGSHTVAACVQAGYEVVIADNFCNSDPTVLERLSELTGREIPCYTIDVADGAALETVFSQHSIEAVIHFAGLKAVGESVAKPLTYYRNNLDTTLTLLETMARHHCCRIVFSSSATVYGEKNPTPYTEQMPTGGCTNPYGRTKYFIEEILKDQAAADPAFSAVLLRYFNPIGAHESGLLGEKPNGIPNNLLPYVTQTAIGIRDHLNVFGNDYPTVDGTGVRDYIHVVDLAKGHVAALAYAWDHTGAEAFNLGTGRGTSVLELVHAFETVNSVSVPYVIAPRRPGDIATSFADPQKAKALLGWQAEKTIQDMCRDAWRWQKGLTGDAVSHESATKIR